MVENIVGGKGDNAGYQHCLLFPQCFQKASSPSAWRVGIVWKFNGNRANFGPDKLESICRKPSGFFSNDDTCL